MAKYSITSEAENDIEEILLYIVGGNLEAAILFNDRLEDIFNMLTDHPDAGRERPELSTGLRSFPLGNYLVFYRIWARNVAIVRVIHGARDLNEIFRS